MAQSFRYHRGAARPIAKLWLRDDDDSLVDLSDVGYSFSLKIGPDSGTALLTKTTSIAGAVGAGVEPTGTPNLTITWAAADLDITPGIYTWELAATLTSLPRKWEGTFEILTVMA